MTSQIAEQSRQLFVEVVQPVLDERFPVVAANTAFGLFGYGSEALGLDDEHSRDHQFGLRIDALMPDGLFQAHAEELREVVSRALPEMFLGMALREGHVAGAGLAPDSMEGFMQRTIGLPGVPETLAEWLSIAEEEVTHVINGWVWRDDSGRFTEIRRAFADYWPEPVRMRRLAHWCRYFSGMGVYALQRALLRDDHYYAHITASRSIRWGVQMAFMLERRFYPYDKWIMHRFRDLPTMWPKMGHLVEAAVRPGTMPAKQLMLLEEMSDILDAELVDQGLIAPHPKFARSPTSGYRVLEHAYAELLQRCPEEIRTLVPEWDQVQLEAFHSGWVAGLPVAEWDAILNLEPASAQST